MIKIAIVTNENSYTLNNVEYQKGTLSINHSIEGISIGGSYANYDEVQCDGNSFSSISELTDWLSQNLFKSGGGSGSGAVDSVTGNIVGGTSANPTINFPIGDNRQVPVYKDGAIIADRLGWPQFSDLPTPPPFLNGVLTGTAFKPDGTALFGFLEVALGEGGMAIIRPNAFPFYNPGIVGNGGGTLPVADAIENGDAVNKGQLDSMMKVGETTFTLNGTQTVFNIPHGLGSTPKSLSVSFSDAGNLNFVQSLRTRNGTNITFTCADPPLAGSQTVYWQVFK